MIAMNFNVKMPSLVYNSKYYIKYEYSYYIDWKMFINAKALTTIHVCMIPLNVCDTLFTLTDEGIGLLPLLNIYNRVNM